MKVAKVVMDRGVFVCKGGLIDEAGKARGLIDGGWLVDQRWLTRKVLGWTENCLLTKEGW